MLNAVERAAWLAGLESGQYARPAQRILVVKLASLGDLLTTTPALRALRTTFPDAHIGVLTTPASAPALRGLDSFDEVITFDKFAFDRPRDALRSLPDALALGARAARAATGTRWCCCTT